MNRETIHAALFARLSAVPGFVTASRRLKHWSDTPGGEQPAPNGSWGHVSNAIELR